MGWKTTALVLGLSVLPLGMRAQAQTADKPNILVIMGDDVGYWNISAYNRGMMGYWTPNIDRIAKEARFSPIITPSSRAPLDVRPSSPARARSGLAS
jgi:hypothetical protein